MKKNDEGIRSLLNLRHNLVKAVREFFYMRGYIEVETPSLLAASAPDPYIDPLKVFTESKGPFYLHTSPEMHMKRLLQHGIERCFQICRVYRVEEHEEVHSTEFTMLEWYSNGDYTDAMKETEELVRFAAERAGTDKEKKYKKPFDVYLLEELFIEITGLDPFLMQRDALFNAMTERGFAGIDEKDDWNSLFFKLLVQEIEPELAKRDNYFIKDWPLSISTMARKKDLNKVERFELYINGLEIANGYTELLDPAEQRSRFEEDNRERKRLGKKTFVIDEDFIESLARLKGPYAGVSLGIDRLLMALLDKKNIDEVTVNRFKV